MATLIAHRQADEILADPDLGQWAFNSREGFKQHRKAVDHFMAMLRLNDRAKDSRGRLISKGAASEAMRRICAGEWEGAGDADAAALIDEQNQIYNADIGNSIRRI